MLVTTIATSMGTRIAPELVTLFPITPCTKTGRKKIAPNIVIATHIPAMFENVKMRLGHRRSGNTGSGARFSTHAKAISNPAEAQDRPRTFHEYHAYWLPPPTAAARRAVMRRHTLP